MVTVFQEKETGFIILDFAGRRVFDGMSMRETVGHRASMKIPDQAVLVLVDKDAVFGGRDVLSSDVALAEEWTRCMAIVCENDTMFAQMQKLANANRMRRFPVGIFKTETEARAWLTSIVSTAMTGIMQKPPASPAMGEVSVFLEGASGFVIVDFFRARVYDQQRISESINKRQALGMGRQRVLVRLDRYVMMGLTDFAPADAGYVQSFTGCMAFVCENPAVRRHLGGMVDRLHPWFPAAVFDNEQAARAWLAAQEIASL